MKEMGKILKSLREKANLTQKELAKRRGLSDSAGPKASNDIYKIPIVTGRGLLGLPYICEGGKNCRRDFNHEIFSG